MAQVYDTQLLPAVRLSPPASPFETQAQHEILVSPTRAVHTAESPKPTLDSILADDEFTPIQKDVAVRISQAADKIRAWDGELQKWSWIGSFATEDAGLQKLRDMTSVDGQSSEDKIAGIQQHAAMPQELANERADRLEDIHRELSDLELERLKAHIFGLHMDDSRPALNLASSTGSHVHVLDDYSFFVTQTLIQVLPIMSSLQQVLAVWSVRLCVVRQSFDYLRSFLEAVLQMENAWILLERSASAGSGTTDDDKNSEVLTAKLECHACVTAAAALLDGMLDMLEGQTDTLPDSWIDAFEELEADFGHWCTAAHKFLFWQSHVEHDQATPASIDPEASAPQPANNLDAAEPATPDETQRQPQELESTGSLATNAMPQDQPMEISSEIANVVALPEIVAPVADGPSTFHADNPDVEAENVSAPILDEQNLVTKDEAEDKSAIEDEAISTKFSAHQVANSIDDSAEAKRRSDTSDYSTKFSESLLGNSVFSEYPAADLTDLTDTYTDVDMTAASPLLRRPQTPDFGYLSDDDAFLEDLAGLSVHSELYDDNMESDVDDSPLRRKQPVSMAPKPPLNAMIKKRAQRAANPTIMASDVDASHRNSQMTPKSTPKNRFAAGSTISPSMPLELQISNILEAIPTPIRFRSGPKASAPDFKQNRKRTDSATQDRRSAATSRSSTPALTLAPAEETSRRKTSGSSEIRLYHLIPSGQEKPIKLFIRRVGENGERVMVRVGGGWADLGEYLRIYAEHHGRRTTSEGRIEMQAMKLPKTGTTPKKTESRRSSLLGTAARAMTPSFGRAGTPTTGEKVGHSAGKSAVAATPDESQETAPQSAASTDSRKTSGWDEVGMSGPRTRRVETSSEKKEWIEGIVEQAKRDFGQHVSVGDLGKSGSTRRIFFKGRKPSGST